MERRIAQTLDLRARQVEKTLELLDDGNTVPFIARYRKEQTQDLDEVQIRDVRREAKAIRQLEDRRQTILESIDEQDELSDELRREIENADSRSRLEDLYAPYRPRRLTRGRKAIEAGLEPVARRIEDGGDPRDIAGDYRCEEFSSIDEVLGGAKDILAEEMADTAAIRDHLREHAQRDGQLVCKKRRGADGDPNFETYTEFSIPVQRAKPHQVLAIRRGEQEKELSAGIEVDEEQQIRWICRQCIDDNGPGTRYYREAIEDGFSRLLHPAIERDVRGRLEDEADEHAIGVFAVNLENLLLQPPMPENVIVGIDPGLRTGCKIVVIGPTGQLIDTGQCYIHDKRKSDASDIVAQFVNDHDADLVAIGNGTGSRETEDVVAEALADTDGVQYAVIDEAGASVYSASDIARREFPDLDVSMRGAVSIARRLQDPLAELVKIDPKSIGVGMYQHDVNQVELRESLEAVVEDVVNSVGVDLNSASDSLLGEVAGIGPTLARRIVGHRQENGSFESRKELKDVRGLGRKTFEQCAGFLRIRDGDEPLDNTGIHPENYSLARSILDRLNADIGDDSIAQQLRQLDEAGRLSALAEDYGVGSLTLADIREALEQPGRDPRDELDPPELRSDVLTMDDLREGMQLEGTVRNVVDFGAFVDIGVKQDGLVHISEMADRFVDSPYNEVGVGDRVEVVILSVDADRGRIGLSIKQAQ